MEISIAAEPDGRLLALDARLTVDCGAFNPWQWNMAYNTAVHLAGPYRIPSLRVDVTYVATNKAPLISIRGAGRPEAAFAMDRSLDRLNPAHAERLVGDQNLLHLFTRQSRASSNCVGCTRR